MKIMRKTQGFTLIEVLAAVAVIALGCLAVLSFHANAVQSGSRADKLTVATFLAESQFEILRSLNFDAIEPRVSEMKSAQACFSGSRNPCDSANFDACYSECLERDGGQCRDPEGRGCFRRTTGLLTKRPTSRTHSVRVQIDWRGPTNDHTLAYESMISAFGFTQ